MMINEELQNKFFNFETNAMFSDKFVSINFKDVFNYKFPTIEKYENLDNIDLSNKIGIYEFIKVLDRYLLQAIEEISETHQEIVKIPLQPEMISESIDILGYLATIGSLFKFEIESINKISNPDFEMIIDLPRYEFYSENKFNYNYDNELDKLEIINTYGNKLLFSILDDIITVRRKFDERKWHKPASKKTIIELLKILNDSLDIINNAMYKTLELSILMMTLFNKYTGREGNIDNLNSYYLNFVYYIQNIFIDCTEKVMSLPPIE